MVGGIITIVVGVIVLTLIKLTAAAQVESRRIKRAATSRNQDYASHLAIEVAVNQSVAPLIT